MKLSVLMLAYNHEPFIRQALDSALMQEVDFPWEIVIGEDCSTDATRAILREYRDRHPDRVRLLLPEKNLGMMRNLVETFAACRGEYIALLEGDDYWTSPGKLQKQVGFLDGHQDCSACFHNVEVVHEDRPERNHLFHAEPLKPFFDLRDVLTSHFIPTCSTVFRREPLGTLPEWLLTMPMGDWALHVLNAERGPIGYLDEVLGAYRVHSAGMWSGTSRTAILEKTVRAAWTIDRHLGSRFRKDLGRIISGWELDIACRLADEGKVSEALRHSWRAVAASPFRLTLYRKSLTKVLLKSVTVRLLGAREGKGSPMAGGA